MSIPTVLLLGASSDVAKALALHYHKHGYALLLAGRNIADLKSFADSLSDQRNVQTVHFDAADFAGHSMWVNALPQLPTVTICVFGYLGDHEKALSDWIEAHRIIDSNYTGAVSILNSIANAYEKQGSGVIAGISSVAGERGRQSNYIYGSAKAGFTAYLSGLRNRLAKKGVHVVTVKPGFMNTQMTTGLKLPKLLTAEPDQAAKRIFSAIQRKRNVVYVLPIWRLIMLVIRSVPEFIFKRLKL